MAPHFTHRPATAADHEAWARLFIELGVDEPPADLAQWLTSFAPRIRMLEEAGRAVGFVMTSRFESLGYVVSLVIAPEARRRGAGRALLQIVAERFRDAGCTEWALRVKTDNLPALRLYESLGMRAHHTSTVLRLAWDQALRLPREEGPFEARPILPADDAALEAAFDLLGGQLAALRSRSGRVQLQLVDPRGPEEARVGLVSFDPASINATPFRVVRPALAPWLLDAMRAYASPGDPTLGLVAEDEALTRALLAAGAVVRFETRFLRGPLPAAER